MSYCAVLVPVLNRPERVAPLVASLEASIGVYAATPYFIVSEFDHEERDAIREAGAEGFVVTWERGRGDYARKINLGVECTKEPWIFLGADDLYFSPGWLDTAVAFAENHSKRVVGTNDLGNTAVIRGRHSTHSLVARSYVEQRGTIDEQGKALHEGYDHQFVDNEFVETALNRGEFVAATAAVVEHLHPHWGKAEYDPTYHLAISEMDGDRRLFRSRRKLWVSGVRRSTRQVARRDRTR